MKSLNILLILLVSSTFIGCGDWSFGWGSSDEPKAPTKEDIEQTKDPEAHKKMAEDALKLLEKQKEVNAKLKADAEKAKLEVAKKDIEKGKAEIEAERAKLDAEKSGSTGDWTTQVGFSIDRLLGDPFLFLVYVLLTLVFFFIYYTLASIKKPVMAYASLVLAIVAISPLGYAAAVSENLGTMVGAASVILPIIFFVKKNSPNHDKD